MSHREATQDPEALRKAEKRARKAEKKRKRASEVQLEVPAQPEPEKSPKKSKKDKKSKTVKSADSAAVEEADRRSKSQLLSQEQPEASASTTKKEKKRKQAPPVDLDDPSAPSQPPETAVKRSKKSKKSSKADIDSSAVVSLEDISDQQPQASTSAVESKRSKKTRKPFNHLSAVVPLEEETSVHQPRASTSAAPAESEPSADAPKRKESRPSSNSTSSSKDKLAAKMKRKSAPDPTQPEPSASQQQKNQNKKSYWRPTTEMTESLPVEGKRGRGRPAKSREQRIREWTTDPSTSQPLSHPQILATFFLKPDQLLFLEREIGLRYTKGAFKPHETEQLKRWIDGYCEQARLDVDGFRELLFNERALAGETFWRDMTASVPGRPINAVYHHVRRMFHADGRAGQWSLAEDKKLRQQVRRLGRSWDMVGKELGRAGADCKDRWVNHIMWDEDEKGQTRHTGTWTPEEEEKLKEAVKELEREHGGASSVGSRLWSQVSAAVGTRSRQQCAMKWARRGWQGLPPLPREHKEKQSAAVSKEVIDSEDDDELDDDEEEDE